MRTLKPAAVGFLLLCLALVSWPSSAAAQTVPFKVFITELWQLDGGVDPVLGVMGDYYAKVTINGVAQDNDGACNDESSTVMSVPYQLFKNFTKDFNCDARTPWVFSKQVPVGQPVHVTIQIFDTDLAFDDEGDAQPGEGKAIDLVIDPSTGQWSGDIAWPQNCSRPNLETGGNNVNVCWQAGVDTDEDGLLDLWELSGADTDNDGTVDLDLRALGAHPQRKDLFVEVDYLVASTHVHSPQRAAIERVVKSFADAPTTNVDGTTGVQLHVDVGPLFGGGAQVPVAGQNGVVGTYGDLGDGNGILEEGHEIIRGFHHADSGGTSFAVLKIANFNPVREPVFRYTIFGHQTNVRAAENDCTSGQANPTRLDFLVTLGGTDRNGSPCWDTDAGNSSVGNLSEQAGTFMHELGHTLGLKHGGHVDANNKPNYLSVMNYSFQSCGIPASPGLLPGACDYSRLVLGELLPTLDETDLDECVGIAGGLGFGAMDWNGNGLFDGVSACGTTPTNATADVNNDGICVKPGPNGRLDSLPSGDDRFKDGGINDGANRVCNTAVRPGTDDQQVTAVDSTPLQPNPLESSDDWGRLAYGMIDFESIAGGGNAGVEQEADPETLRESRRFTGDLTAPRVMLDVSGPATAKPGDLLTYTVTVTNTGRGPALSAVLQATNPDGHGQTSELGTVPVGAEVTQAATFAVPANACPGQFSGAAASMLFKDFVGRASTATDLAPLQILDVVAPAFDVSLSPSILWPPNHKLQDVTATITTRDNCDPDPDVTLVSITSNEPAEGFLGNGDRGPDIQGAAFGTDDRQFSLRAERGTGHGRTGRIYTVTYRVTDASGNVTEKTATVTVPANNSGH